MNFSASELNIVDLIALFVILISVIGGIKRGFISGALDLVGLVAGIYFAFKGYSQLGGLVADTLPLPRGVINLGSFVGLFVVTQAIFALVFGLFFRGIRRLVRLLPFLRVVDAFAGILPGLVKGVVGATLLILTFGLFPIIPVAKDQIERSYLGSRTITMASELAPRLESVLGQAADDTLTFMSRSQPGKPLKLDLPVASSLTLDSVSEQRMLELLNGERIKAGLQPLVMDERLQSAARAHSKEMFELSYFAHDSPVSGSPSDRMLVTGARFIIAAENLAYAPNVEMAHSGLMNSPGHRKNILTPGLRRIGIGVIDGGLKGKMFTQDFTD